MCGIAGIYNWSSGAGIDAGVLERMTGKLVHRGPDDCGYYTGANAGLGFRRLALIDLERAAQPMFNENGSIVCVCNGEIYNYRELRQLLAAKGHHFLTEGDCEVLPHLYEEYGLQFLERLNAQFSLALYDVPQQMLVVARDPFGVNPLFYTSTPEALVFASEIKSILEYPGAPREVDLAGLDQVLCFPGLVSPRTMFKGIFSLPAGHYVAASPSGMREGEYWDLIYPTMEELQEQLPESCYVERLSEALFQSVSLRLQADVPVGVYLSGGLDSSLVASLAGRTGSPRLRNTFSISFPQQNMCEGTYQRRVASEVGAIHHEIPFDPARVAERLQEVVYHAECPVKETYNTACLALSDAARTANTPVILTGQGADEMFAGYIGYRLDKFYENGRKRRPEYCREQQLRFQLWGDTSLIYDNNYAAIEQLRTGLYSEPVKAALQDSNAFSTRLVNPDRLAGRHPVHKRSYLDFHLRLADHLLADHGDRMAMAHAVELRHPFLDLGVMRCAIRTPPDLKLHGYTEKYVLKKLAEPFVNSDVIARDKFGWYAPGTPALLGSHRAWVEDLLADERIRRQGYFDPQAVSDLKRQYSADGFTLNQPFETDLLLVVLTFGLLLDAFGLPAAA